MYGPGETPERCDSPGFLSLFMVLKSQADYRSLLSNHLQMKCDQYTKIIETIELIIKICFIITEMI